MHTEPLLTVWEVYILSRLARVTIAAWAALSALAIAVWYPVMVHVLSIQSWTFYGATSALIAASLAIAALAFYWEHTD